PQSSERLGSTSVLRTASGSSYPPGWTMSAPMDSGGWLGYHHEGAFVKASSPEPEDGACPIVRVAPQAGQRVHGGHPPRTHSRSHRPPESSIGLLARGPVARSIVKPAPPSPRQLEISP